MKKVKKQSGFTLVEIAIVLVVIGLLLGGVLKGQELIESSKVKSMAKDLTSYSTMMTAYQDRYRGVPGDDLTATTNVDRGWGLATAKFAAGDNDALIGTPTVLTNAATMAAATNKSETTTVENFSAIQALRYAGFLEGDVLMATPLRNAVGGYIAFTNGVLGIAHNVVCFSGLNGKQAGALDRLLDDGISNTGRVRSIVTTMGVGQPAAATAYADGTIDFILCKEL